MKENYLKYIDHNLNNATPETFLKYVEENNLPFAEAFIDFTTVRNYLVLDKGMSAKLWDNNMLEKLKKVCGGE